MPERMVSEKECQPRLAAGLLTVVGQRAENDWRFSGLGHEEPVSEGRPKRDYAFDDQEALFLKRATFTKADRIRTAIEYRLLAKYGARCYSDHFIIISRENQRERSRLGITVSKKVGKAVTRNRIKRSIREYFRLNRTVLPVRLDINIIARQTSRHMGAGEIKDHLGACFETIAGKTRIVGR